MQKTFLKQANDEICAEYRRDISCHPSGSSRSIRNAEKAGPETGDADDEDESSDGSSNCGSESGDQEGDEDEEFEARW